MARPVTDADLMFPADVSEWLPSYDTVPDEFKRLHGSSRNPYVEFVSAAFYEGIKEGEWATDLKKGITEEQAKEAYRQFLCCLGSFQPKHEHKFSGCAFLLSQFFDPPRRAKGRKNL